ncbi:MAG TPA: GerMN domain-containing protein [Vicinamibacterales bacterium]|nr:GerMN domain-containing protein [Vicinamibacterales bacterium]
MSDDTPVEMPPPPAPNRGQPWPFSRRAVWFAIAGGIALSLGVWLVIAKLPRLLTTSPGDPPAAASSGATGDARKIHVTLFYVAENGSELVLSNAEVPFGETPVEQARRIVEAQVQPPPEGTVSAIPAGTKVRAVYLSPRGEAYIDLSRDVSRGHTGGSLSESLAVFAIVNAVTINLPDITAVQILIDGKETDTLAGHIDLRHPLKRALEWVRR